MSRHKHGSEAKDSRSDRKGVNRRDFLTSAGLGTFGLAATRSLDAAPVPSPAAEPIAAHRRIPVSLDINEFEHTVLVESRWSLAYVLRERLGITGTKVGCGRGECGACTVLIDGRPRYSCMTLAAEAVGHPITTVEGLLEGESLGAVQQAFLENDAFQCGYCTPGQIMAVEGLLRSQADPSLAEIRTGVSGNLCRCGAYVNIFKAARRAAELERRGGGGS